MSALLSTVMEAAHVGFALFARKLILCGELIAIVAMVGWNIDARVGLSLWPQRTLGTSRASAVLAAGATVLVVLFVAFVRDLADLGANPSFLRYGGMCLGVMAVVTSCAAMWVHGLGGRFDLLGLIGVWAVAAAGVVCIHVGEVLCSGPLEPIGQLFRAGPERIHHGLAAVLASVGALALLLRLITTKGRLPSPSPWDLFLVSCRSSGWRTRESQPVHATPDEATSATVQALQDAATRLSRATSPNSWC
jgi:hypothetical protein